MRYIAPVLVCAALAAPLPILAQGANEDGQSGGSLIEQGFEMLLEGFFKEAEPALDELQGLAESFEPMIRDFAESAGPALQELVDEIGDLSLYEAPERLPNGDIILRRKTPLKPEADEKVASPEEFEL